MRKAFYLSVLLSSTLAFAQTHHLTLDEILDNGAPRRGGESGTSPDGKYTASQGAQITLHPAGGGEAKAITSTPGAKSELSWSPDSHHITYISDGDVWIASISGGDPIRLTHDPTGPGDPRGATDHHPQFNPNGHWILYESGRKGFNELYVVSDDGKQSNLIAATEIYTGADIIKPNTPDHGDAVSSDRFDPRPLWSPDGTRISYTERSRPFFSGKLKVLPFNQSTGQPSSSALDLYIAKNDIGGAWAINTDVWSPNSKTLAVVLQETAWDKLFLIPSTGGKPQQLTFGDSEDENPLYSPDGKWIAFESNRGLPEERHIWVVPSAGGHPHRITDFDGIEGQPHFSADSQTITFTRTTTLGSSATYTATVATTSEPKLLGSIHHSIYENAGITPEVIRYKSKDSTPIAAILYKPLGYQPGTRYPTVVIAHGGPEGQTLLTVAPWSIYLAQHGYVVLEPNFRGSTGYGERFRNSNFEDSGGGEIDDVVAGVQHLTILGLTDPKHVGISGGSHGGTVVANAVAKYPDVFAVGIEKFGVVDRALFLQYTNRNSAIRWETKMGGPPSAKPAVYRKANILPDVAKIKTPLLVLHGEEDPQVPPQESQQLTAALKQLGKTYDYKTYPHEGHGFQQRDHRKDADERELAYLDKYLKPTN